MPAALQTEAEIVFEEYLTRHGIAWDYETLPGLKKPDYVVSCASGKCVVEVKQIEDPDPRPTEGFYPDKPVRKKIKRAREQFREYHEPSILMAAAFGPSYQQVGRDYSRIDPRPPTIAS